MKQYILSAVKFIVFLGLGAFLVWLAVKDLTEEDKSKIAESLFEANYLWIVLAMAGGIFSHYIRAIRWKMLLEPLGLTPQLSNTFYAVMIGYLGNLVLPRLGEVLRCGILKRYEKISLTQSFGTVITERIIDLSILFLLFITSIWLEYDRLNKYISDNIFHPIKLKLHSLTENTTMLLLIIGIAAAISLSLFIFRKKIFRNPAAKKLHALLMGFLEGIRTATKVKNPLLFIFHSIFIWAIYLATVYLCIFTFKETESLTLSDCLVLMCFGSLGIIATPGGIGAYQWIVLQIMLLWGYSTAISVAFGWIVWLAQLVVVLTGGLLSFGMLAINNRENAKSQTSNHKPASPAGG